jgi:uncharacterized protein YdhG (YjbR/CyaY superfamily)
MTVIDYFETIPNPEHQTILRNLIDWTLQEFPELDLEIKWNQPMLLDHGTFILGFSVATNHFNIAPEKQILDRFETEIKQDYVLKKKLFSIKWNQDINYHLLRVIIAATMEEKKDYDKFWL